MNQTEFPLLNKADTGVVFAEPARTVDVDHQALEIACINLISKLENLLAKSRELDHDDFIDESAEVASGMLESLAKFTNEYLSEGAAEQALEEIGRGTTATLAYEATVKARPLTKAVIRTFWDVAECEDITSSHAQLGEALVRSCAATFYHAVLLVGLDSELGQEVDQSTVVFVNELKACWK